MTPRLLVIGFAGLVCSFAACSGTAPSFFAPSLTLDVRLPVGLEPGAVPCLDVELVALSGEAPRTSIGFGGDPLLLNVSTFDGNGDGLRETTRIRFVNGSRPFLADSLSMRITASPGSTIEGRTFGVAAVIRLADGFVEATDKCLGGTVMARTTGTESMSIVVTRGADGQPIRFPTRGDINLPLPLSCILADGCNLAAPDAGVVVTDAGVADAGVTDGGITDGGADGGRLDAGIADGGRADGGRADGGTTDGGALDGGRDGG